MLWSVYLCAWANLDAGQQKARTHKQTHSFIPFIRTTNLCCIFVWMAGHDDGGGGDGNQIFRVMPLRQLECEVLLMSRWNLLLLIIFFYSFWTTIILYKRWRQKRVWCMWTNHMLVSGVMLWWYVDRFFLWWRWYFEWPDQRRCHGCWFADVFKIIEMPKNQSYILNSIVVQFVLQLVDRSVDVLRIRHCSLSTCVARAFRHQHHIPISHMSW